MRSPSLWSVTRVVATTLLLGVFAAPAGAAVGDGVLGGTAGPVSGTSKCVSGIGVTSITGASATFTGYDGVIRVKVGCQTGAASGTIGTRVDQSDATKSCGAGQVAVGIAGVEGTLVNQVKLRCQAETVTGAIVTGVGIPQSANGGDFEDTVDCPAGKQLVALAGTVTSDPDATVQTLTVTCDLPDRDGDGVLNYADNCIDIANPGQENTAMGAGAEAALGDACDGSIGDNRLGGNVGPVHQGTSCTRGAGVTSLSIGLGLRYGALLPVGVTVACEPYGSASGRAGVAGTSTASTACAAGEVAIGITGREGDMIGSIRLRCRAVADPGGAVSVSPLGGQYGASGVQEGNLDCPAGQHVVGLDGTTSPVDISSDIRTGDVRDLRVVCGTEDIDGDGVVTAVDNCRFVANAGQTDTDLDGHGDACDSGRLGGEQTATTGATACPAGVALTGLAAGTKNVGTDIVIGLRASCQSGDPDGTLGTVDLASPATTACPAGQIAIGIAGRESDNLDNIALRCRAADLTGDIAPSAAVGGTGGEPEGPLDCPAGQYLTGLDGSTDAGEVRQVQIRCATRNVPPPTTTGGDKPPTGTPATPAPERIGATVTARWTVARTYALLRRLVVGGIPAGATVTVSCKGKGCPFRTRTFTRDAKRGAVATKPFRNKRLRPGVVLEVRVTKPGAIGRVVKYTLAKGKKPRPRTLCLPVGATKPVRTC